MKHVTFGDKTLLMGDDAADSLLEYASLLAKASTSDTVSVTAISSDGNTVDVSFLLNSNSVMVVESTNSTIEAPDNTQAVRYMQYRIERLLQPQAVRPHVSDDSFDYDYDYNLGG